MVVFILQCNIEVLECFLVSYLSGFIINFSFKVLVDSMARMLLVLSASFMKVTVIKSIIRLLSRLLRLHGFFAYDA